MEAKGVKFELVLIVIAMAMGVLVLSSSLVEGAFGIQLNPCTLPQCIAECKKALHEKFLSATCASGPQGKFCICLDQTRPAIEDKSLATVFWQVMSDRQVGMDGEFIDSWVSICDDLWSGKWL
ncbi:hypothetical protein Gogos_016236, partial [Gossypium gossypioides]|nr:hypothetical protein [Gossypium gossypioides]